MSTVYANARLILSKGDGLVHVAAAPDVCKTPTPAGPQPIPYPNLAMDSDLVGGSTNVKVVGQPAALARAKLSQSSGDEAGAAGGVVSGMTKGPMSWASASPDVLIEGSPVVRFMDQTLHNGSGASNTMGMAMGWAKP